MNPVSIIIDDKPVVIPMRRVTLALADEARPVLAVLHNQLVGEEMKAAATEYPKLMSLSMEIDRLNKQIAVSTDDEERAALTTLVESHTKSLTKFMQETPELMARMSVPTAGLAPTEEHITTMVEVLKVGMDSSAARIPESLAEALSKPTVYVKELTREDGTVVEIPVFNPYWRDFDFEGLRAWVMRFRAMLSGRAS